MQKYKNYYFQTERIRLRLWEPKDHAASSEIDLDSKCLAFVQEEVVLPSQSKSVDTNANYAEPNIAAPAFSITDLIDNYIGHIHFNYINERHGTFSIALLLKESERGKGYGKDALLLLIKYAFEERRLHKFDGYCYDENIASARLMESIGCKREGVSRECVYMNGKYHDRIIYGMTSDEYFSLYGN